MAAIITINGNAIQIKQATSIGYIELPLEGGIADLSFEKSKLRRGRVQHNGQICPALTCGINGLYIFINTKQNKERTTK